MFETIAIEFVPRSPMLWHQEFLRSVATAASQVADASFAQNGFWADHWTYTLDLVENYLMIYPGTH